MKLHPISEMPNPLRSKWESVTDHIFSKRREITDDEGKQHKDILTLLDAEIAMDIYRKYQYIPDVGDIWAKPEEFSRKGGGDCEDFAIARMHYLWHSEFLDAGAMSLVIGNYMGRIVHAVLRVNTVKGFYILDSMQSYILPEEAHYKSFTPLIGIQRDGWWTA